MPRPRTYKQAQADFIAFLESKGWKFTEYSMRGPLKIPYVTNPDQTIRLWFKAQAIYFTTAPTVTDYKTASSLWFLDIREDTPEVLYRLLKQRFGGKVAKAAASSYRDDPRWIRAKYPGIAEGGEAFKKGEEILWWPRTKTIMVGPRAEEAWARFQAEVQDEDFYNRRGSESPKK